MNKIILLIKKVYLLVIFIILEVTAINYYANSTSFTRAKILTVSNAIFFKGYGASSDMKNYIGLRDENDRLAAEVVSLKEQLEHYRQLADTCGVYIDLSAPIPYRFELANVINNSLFLQNNYITLDKGTSHGVEPDMAITTTGGAIVGYVQNCSNKFSVCMSILNTGFHASGQLKNTDSYGPVFWDGTSDEFVTLSDIPKYTTINKGDTIVTTSFSTIFPPGVMIGTVESYQFNQSMLYEIKVRLAARLSDLRRVVLVKYHDAAERMRLEEDAKKQNKQQGTH